MARDAGYSAKLVFDASEENRLEVVRQIFWNRLRADASFNQLTESIDPFLAYVDIPNKSHYSTFACLLLDVFWDLVNQRVVCPGTTSGNPSTKVFHLTDHGTRALAEPDYQPHDPTEYLRQLGQPVSSADATVLAYLGESLHCYTHNVFVASTMMLGIAAERVFILVCESLFNSLKDSKERAEFQKLLERNPMKPKMDWLADKFRKMQEPKRPRDLPEDMDVMTIGVYNLVRCQRNEVGHPRPAPPTVTRDAAYSYLRMFPSYYATAEKVREFLTKNKV